MRRNTSRDDISLYQANVGMMILCGMTVFWVLTSPLVPYVFDVTTTTGLALFLALQVIFTALFGAFGVWLNTLTACGERVTAQSFRLTSRKRR